MTTLLLNGRVHSPSHPDATALAVRDGVVAWLGSDDIGRAQFPGARTVDLDGCFVAPAFVDSHIHLTATGLLRTGLDLSSATSRRHCLQLLADYVARHPGQPVWGHGWDDTAWPGEPAPSTAEIDAVVGTAPAYLARVDVHSAVASSALRDLVVGLAAVAGFDPQGPLSADAHHLVRAEARRLLTWRQRDDARRAALDAAAAAGIVAVHECAGPQIGGAEDWQEVRGTEHGVEVVGYWGEAVSTAAQARALIDATGAAGLAGDLFVDGALGSHTAWLCRPYADAPDRTGNCYLDPTVIAEHLSACTEAGVTAGFHVIGDA
ncbi:MAG TPA: amidohydrolase family protein, partial [Mycobacterium sp.]|nr:amidohydrolase family protein [Mycobacterium sp.]